MTFGSLFGAMSARNEIICTFLALLELIRLRQVTARQPDRFGEIYIVAIMEEVTVPTWEELRSAVESGGASEAASPSETRETSDVED